MSLTASTLRGHGRVKVLSMVMLAVAAWPGGVLATDRASGKVPEVPQGPDVVTSFLNRRDPPVTSYRARRRLVARSERLSKEGWLEAITELGAGRFTYRVIAEGGSDTVRREVLHAALEAERDLTGSQSAAFDATNYRFAADGYEGPLARIRVTPMRKDKRLVEGWLLVAPESGELVAVKGHLAKTPSFWTTRVDVVRRYERIGGVRVPVALESTASVRLAGPSTFHMSYTYETINGVPVAR